MTSAEAACGELHATRTCGCRTHDSTVSTSIARAASATRGTLVIAHTATYIHTPDRIFSDFVLVEKNANVIVLMLKLACFRYSYWCDKERESFINVPFLENLSDMQVIVKIRHFAEKNHNVTKRTHTKPPWCPTINATRLAISNCY